MATIYVKMLTGGRKVLALVLLCAGEIPIWPQQPSTSISLECLSKISSSLCKMHPRNVLPYCYFLLIQNTFLVWTSQFIFILNNSAWLNSITTCQVNTVRHTHGNI